MKSDNRALDTDVLAELEVAWWQSYHERDFSKLAEKVTELREAQFGVEISAEAAGDFVKAAESYINYKKALAQADDDEAEMHLDECRQYMKRHYADIKRRVR